MGAIFISYSRQDSKQLEELQGFLKPLERDFSLKPWTDRQIQPGDDWKAAIDQALAEANIGLLLVTQAFVASDFIAKHELPYLLDKPQRGQLSLIPVFCQLQQRRHRRPGTAEAARLRQPGPAPLQASKAAREEKLAALSQRLLELCQSAKPVLPTRPGRPVDLSKEPPLPTREYSLSAWVERQGKDWACQYRLPGNPVFAEERQAWATVWPPLQALLDMLAKGERGAIQGMIATAKGYWGQALFNALFGMDEQKHGAIFRAAFHQQGHPTPVRAGLRLRIASGLPDIARLPWRLMAWQGHSLAQNGWVFLSGQTPDSLLDIRTSAPDNLLLIDGMEE